MTTKGNSPSVLRELEIVLQDARSVRDYKDKINKIIKSLKTPSAQLEENSVTSLSDWLEMATSTTRDPLGKTVSHE